jgi:hypothetical protein
MHPVQLRRPVRRVEMVVNDGRVGDDPVVAFLWARPGTSMPVASV